MGLFNQSAQMPMTKEIEIDCKCDANVLLSALQQAGLKAKQRGDAIQIKSKMMSSTSVNGTLLNADGEWTGSIIIAGKAQAVINQYSSVSAVMKKFIK